MITNKDKKFNSYQYLGAIHIHSTFSDGTGDIEKISNAAKKAGLDWVIVTDHNSMEIEEGFYNGVCVIKGEEISPEGANHYLAFGINRLINPSEPAKFVDEVRMQGGFGFAAHPDEGVNERKNSYPPIKWTDKKIIPDGLEIWNWFSQWGDNFNDKNILTLAYSYLFKNRLVTEPNRETIAWWDSLNNNSDKIVPAIGGIDAHAMKINGYLIPVTIFPYEKMFKTITNVLTFNEPLSEDFETRKSQILTAIKEGNNLIVNRNVNKFIPEINLAGKVKTGNSLEIVMNKKSLVKIFHNGMEIYSKLANKCSLLLKEVGKYRVEIKIGNRGFAYTNPILVY